MLVIGLVGLAQSGKSTVAEHLIARHGFKQGKYAKALKQMLRELLRYRGCTDDEIDRMIEGDLKEVSSPHLGGKTPRYAMQTLGTEWGRDCIGADFWVETEADHLNLDGKALRNDQPSFVVFDDVRFQNEVDLIRRHRGEIWEISRTFVRQTAPEGSHVSETLAATPDRLLVNSATKAELRAFVDMMLYGARRRLAYGRSAAA